MKASGQNKAGIMTRERNIPNGRENTIQVTTRSDNGLDFTESGEEEL